MHPPPPVPTPLNLLSFNELCTDFRFYKPEVVAMLHVNENDVFSYLLAEAVPTTGAQRRTLQTGSGALTQPSAGLLAGTVYQFIAALLHLGKGRPHRSPKLVLLPSPLRWTW